MSEEVDVVDLGFVGFQPMVWVAVECLASHNDRCDLSFWSGLACEEDCFKHCGFQLGVYLWVSFLFMDLSHVD